MTPSTTSLEMHVLSPISKEEHLFILLATLASEGTIRTGFA